MPTLGEVPLQSKGGVSDTNGDSAHAHAALPRRFPMTLWSARSRKAPPVCLPRCENWVDVLQASVTTLPVGYVVVSTRTEAQ